MKGIIYIPYINTEYDNNEFDYDKDIDYISDLDNVKTNIIGDQNYYKFIEKKTIGANFNYNPNSNKIKEIDGIIKYYELNCVLIDENDKFITIDRLLSEYRNESSFMMSFIFNPDESSDGSLIELKGWITESNKVLELPDELYSEDIKMGMLPKRDFRFATNNQNLLFKDCLFFDFEKSKVTIYVNKIIFFK